MCREGLSSSRGNNRYGGVRQEITLRNTNTAMIYLSLQELVPKAERNLLVLLVMPILMRVLFFIFINCNCSRSRNENYFPQCPQKYVNYRGAIWFNKSLLTSCIMHYGANICRFQNQLSF